MSPEGQARDLTPKNTEQCMEQHDRHLMLTQHCAVSRTRRVTDRPAPHAWLGAPPRPVRAVWVSSIDAHRTSLCTSHSARTCARGQQHPCPEEPAVCLTRT